MLNRVQTTNQINYFTRLGRPGSTATPAAAAAAATLGAHTPLPTDAHPWTTSSPTSEEREQRILVLHKINDTSFSNPPSLLASRVETSVAAAAAAAPALRACVPSPSVSVGEHPWIASSPTSEEREQRILVLAKINDPCSSNALHLLASDIDKITSFAGATFPDTLTYLKIEGCKGFLENIHLPNKLTHLRLEKCTGGFLRKINLPSTLTHFYFHDCTGSLVGLAFQEGVEVIDIKNYQGPFDQVSFPSTLITLSLDGCTNIDGGNCSLQGAIFLTAPSSNTRLSKKTLTIIDYTGSLKDARLNAYARILQADKRPFSKEGAICFAGGALLPEEC